MDTLKNKSKDELIKMIESLQKAHSDQTVFSDLNIGNFLSFLNDIIFVFDSDQRFLYVNNPSDSKLLLKPTDFIGKKLNEVMSSDITEKFKKAFEKNIKGEFSDFKYQSKIDNQILWFSARLSPIFENNKFKGSIALISDTTENEKAVLKLNELNQKLLKASEIADFGFLDWDLTTNKLFLSPEIYKIYGIPNKVIDAGEFINKVVHPDDKDYVNKNLDSAIKGLKNYNIDHRIIRTDGTVVWLNNRAELIKDAEGKALKLIGTVQNITEKVAAHKKREEEELKFRILAENTYDWEYWIDPQGNYKYISPSCKRITGYSEQEFIDNPELMFDLVHPDYKEKVHKHYRDENNKNTPIYSCYFPITSKTGKLHWINHNCSPVFDEKGNFLGRRGNNRDISDIKMAEYELKSQNEEYQALNEEYKLTNEELRTAKEKAEENEILFREIFNTVPDPMSISTILTGKYLLINEGFTNLTGFTEKETIGNTVQNINLWNNFNDRDRFIKQLQKEGSVYNFEAEFKMKDGRVLPGLVSANRIEIKGVTHLLVITRDISELKKIQTNLELSEEKFKSLFNNITDAVYVYPFSESGYEPFIEVNDAACKMLGYTKEEFYALSVENINSTDEVKEKGRKKERQILNKKGLYNLESEHITKSGEKIPVEINSLVFELLGKKTIVSIVRDISEMKKTKDQLKMSEDKFKKAFYTSPDSININRLKDGSYIDINEGFTKIMGYSQKEVISKTSVELNIWNSVQDREKLVQELGTKGYVENMEAEFKTKTGEIKIGLMSASVISLNNEECILSITREITDRKKVDEELEKYRQHLEDLVKERTEELETMNSKLAEANKDLEKFNELFVGREFRIKELKNKVKELEEKLNTGYL